MKIAMVSEHASPLAVMGGEDAGGQNVHVAALARHLARAGHEVTVWTRRDDAARPARVVSEGVAVAHVDAGPPRTIAKDQLPRWMDDFADRLADDWRCDPPDAIHAHFWMSGRAALRARPLGTPVLQTFHALGVVKRRHLGLRDPSPDERLRIEEEIARSADRIIATCCDELRELHSMGADPDRVDVVPCGVDLDHFRPDGPREERGGRPRIVVVSRLVPRKGVDDAIRALAALPDAELVVAGGPQHDELFADPEVRRLRTVARQCGVADRVKLRGALPRSEVAALLRSADVVACTPWYEPFGIVPLEAMASGVPVVASAVGGMLDSVVDGVTGLLIPPRDPLALAAAVGRLLGDHGFRARLGAAGRRHAVDHYAWGTVAAGTLASYHAACDARSQGAVVGPVPR
jgi:D-inositol-3-phosphate glycosyltransferase